MTRLVLVRHAEPGNGKAAAAAFAGLDLAAVYTSPLARAADTARPIADARGLTPIEIDDLREIDLGEVEGLAFDDFPAELQEGLLRAPTTVRFPGGETYGELKERVGRAIDVIVTRHPDATVIAVSHAGSIRAALASWLGIADAALFRIDQRYGAVNLVDWIDGVPLVRLVNGTCPSG